MLLSECLIEHGSFALDHYNIPRLEPVYHDHTWKNGNIYQLEVVGQHFYYYSPPGSSVLSVPFVLVMNAFGVSAHNADGTYNPEGEARIETLLASLLMAALCVVFFVAARLMLPWKLSLLVAVGATFGTQIWSTTSRALWADTWGLLLSGLVVWLLMVDIAGQRRANPVVLASLLSWMYFVRPSNAVIVIAVTFYVALKRREIFNAYALTGAVWLALFVVYSWIHYHAFLPTYFRINKRLNFDHFAAATAGNLVSPSRGLFVFVPVALFVFFIAWRFRKEVVSLALLYLSLSVLVLYLFAVSTFDPWWAGASFGPRYLAPLVPWMVLMAVLELDVLRRAPKTVGRRTTIAVGSVLLLISVAINGIGAFSERAWQWNSRGDIDHDPLKVWRVRDSQLAAAIVQPPTYDQFFPLPEKVELSSREAERYLGNGWSGAEPGFRWTDGNEATIRFTTTKQQDVVLSLSLTPFLVPGKLDQQRLEVFCNGISIQTLDLHNDGPGLYEFRLPANVLRTQNLVTLRLPDAAPPSEFGTNPDPRRLGVAVQWVGLRGVE